LENFIYRKGLIASLIRYCPTTRCSGQQLEYLICQIISWLPLILSVGLLPENDKGLTGMDARAKLAFRMSGFQG
jgi:hypothetical protein